MKICFKEKTNTSSRIFCNNLCNNFLFISLSICNETSLKTATIKITNLLLYSPFWLFDTHHTLFWNQRVHSRLVFWDMGAVILKLVCNLTFYFCGIFQIFLVFWNFSRHGCTGHTFMAVSGAMTLYKHFVAVQSFSGLLHELWWLFLKHSWHRKFLLYRLSKSPRLFHQKKGRFLASNCDLFKLASN